jgi:effector-binding domain-containing protein
MAYEIEVKDLEERYAATIRAKTTPDGIGETFRELVPEIMAQLNEAGVQPSNPLFGLYHAYGEDQVDMEVGFPLPKAIPTEGRVAARELPATLAAVTWHHGSYANIKGAYQALEAWIEKEGREPNGPPWEVYWTGPSDAPDPGSWRTEVGYPIK